jgi:hypothetical protein
VFFFYGWFLSETASPRPLAISVAQASGLISTDFFAAIGAGGEGPSFFMRLYQGDPIASAIVATIIVPVVFYGPLVFAFMRRLASSAREYINRNSIVVTLLIILWLRVALVKSTTVTEADSIRQEFSGHARVMQALRASSGSSLEVISPRFIDQSILDVLVVDPSNGTCLVWDSGAKRHVYRDPSRAIPGTWKPPDVNIRGVTGGTSSPLGIMDVLERFPLSDLLELFSSWLRVT